ncbi:MAG: endonuclease/exonuclease/phosphatase family protein [Pseudomonadota bacterium]|nr:endonuclease/exonuclease/phosphatase family protein [Pseudomonadota bacterium]
MKRVKILSANVLADFLSPKNHPWAKRKGKCIKNLLSINPDIICLQELSKYQYQDLKTKLSLYQILDNNLQHNSHPMNAILYKKNLFEEEESLILNLPNSIGNENIKRRIPRYANYVKLKNLSNNCFLNIINTHLSYDCSKLSILQVDIILNFIKNHNILENIIFTGDMNNTYNSSTMIKIFDYGFKDTYKFIHEENYKNPTFHSFRDNFNRDSKIDWILVKNLSGDVIDANVLDYRPASEYGSDHFFVAAEFLFK